MQVGEIVIHNDVLGVVTNIEQQKCFVKNREGKTFTFDCGDCTSVIKPAALALLTYEKLVTRIKRN